MERFDYSAAMAELEGILAKVEDPATSLDDIDGLIARADKVSRQCREYLRSARERVESLDTL